MRAPTDFGAAGLGQIAKNAWGTWQNFYQTDSQLLHSGPITQAAKNSLRSYPGTADFEAHNDVLSDPQTVTDVQTALRAAFP